jgi:hypothetical protein
MKYTPIILCAALALAACESGKNYKDMPMDEKITFEKCRAEFLASSNIIQNKTGTIGGAIDGTLESAKRLGELNRKAIKECGYKHGVNPKSVPGYR